MIKEYLTANNQETRIQIEDSKIDATKTKNITQKSVRVFDKEKKILSLAAAVGNVSDDELEKKAIDLLALGIPFEYELEKDTKGNFIKEKLSIKDNIELETLTERILNDLKDISKDFVISGVVSTNTAKRTLKNTLHLDLSVQRTLIDCSLSLKQKGSGNIFDAGAGFSGFDITDKKYQDFLKETEFIAKACLSKEVPLENKIYKVLSNSWNLTRKFHSDINGIEYEEKTSLLAGKLNEKVFNENFCINECHDYENLNIFVPFDHEGIVRKEELVIVDKGVLKNVFFDKKQAHKYGKVSTGNGFREYNTNPLISSRGIRFLGVETKVTDLISDSIVIVPFISSGGDFLPNGNFSLPIQLAFVFENGKFIGKAPQITLIGNYLDCFNKDFIALGKNDLLEEMLSETMVLCNMRVNVN